MVFKQFILEIGYGVLHFLPLNGYVLFHSLKQDVEFNQKLSSKRPQKSQLCARNIFFWSEIGHEF